MNTGVKTKSPLFRSTNCPLEGPLTRVTLTVPAVGGDAPLQPTSFVVTELTKIWLTLMVKKSSVAFGHGPGAGVVVGVAVVEVVVEVVVVVVPQDGGAPGQSQPQQSSALQVTTAGLVTPYIPRAVARGPLRVICKTFKSGGATSDSKLRALLHSPFIPDADQEPRNSIGTDGRETYDSQSLPEAKFGADGTNVPFSTMKLAYAEMRGVQVLLTKNEHVIWSGHPAGFTMETGINCTQKGLKGGGVGRGRVVGAGVVVVDVVVVVVVVVVVGKRDVVGAHPGPIQISTSNGTT